MWIRQQPGLLQGDRGPDLFRQVGYLKSEARDRVFTIAYSPEATEHDIRTRAAAEPYTSGQMTAVYFFPIPPHARG